MNETMMRILTWAICAAAGAVLGVAFFGGLWWTIQKAVRSSRPAVWFLASLLVRMGFVLGGFYAVASLGWLPILFCLTGFVISRFVITALTGPTPDNRPSPASEPEHAH